MGQRGRTKIIRSMQEDMMTRATRKCHDVSRVLMKLEA